MIRRFIAWVLGRRLIRLNVECFPDVTRIERFSNEEPYVKFDWGNPKVFLLEDGKIKYHLWAKSYTVLYDYRKDKPEVPWDGVV